MSFDPKGSQNNTSVIRHNKNLLDLHIQLVRQIKEEAEKEWNQTKKRS